MFTMVFGTLDQAVAAARRLHLRHAAITGVMPNAAGPFAAGSRYGANETSALRWVHSTLIETALIAHDLVHPPLSSEDRARYYAETRMFAALFGIPQASLPSNWEDFASYNEMIWGSEALTVIPEARAIAAQVLGGTKVYLRAPRWYKAVTAALLPPRLRTAFELPYDEAQPAPRQIGDHMDPARLSCLAGAAALCGSLSRGRGAAIRESASRPLEPTAKSTLDWAASAG
jgi:uncharacterized protein (DUF2236 family)